MFCVEFELVGFIFKGIAVSGFRISGTLAYGCRLYEAGLRVFGCGGLRSWDVLFRSFLGQELLISYWFRGDEADEGWTNPEHFKFTRAPLKPELKGEGTLDGTPLGVRPANESCRAFHFRTAQPTSPASELQLH